MSEVTIGFSQLIEQMMKIFQIAYTEAQIIWNFLITPLGESAGEGLAEFLGEDIAALAPLEFMVGAGLILAIVYAMVKFFLPF